MEFKETLIKLSKNKALYKERNGKIKGKKNINDNLDSIESFFICNKLDFNISDICMNDIYGNIHKNEWHNAEYGLIAYTIDCNKFEDYTIEHLKYSRFYRKNIIWSNVIATRAMHVVSVLIKMTYIQ